MKSVQAESSNKSIGSNEIKCSEISEVKKHWKKHFPIFKLILVADDNDGDVGTYG